MTRARPLEDPVGDITSLGWAFLHSTCDWKMKTSVSQTQVVGSASETKQCIRIRTLTILLLISWKWISQTFSTTSSFSKVTNPNPEERKSPDTQTAVYIWISTSAIIINNVYSPYTSVQLQVRSSDETANEIFFFSHRPCSINIIMTSLKSTMILPCFLDMYQGSTIVYIKVPSDTF